MKKEYMFKEGTLVKDTVNKSALKVNGAITLPVSVLLPLQAVTKDYVDSKSLSLDISSILSGTVSVGSLLGNVQTSASTSGTLILASGGQGLDLKELHATAKTFVGPMTVSQWGLISAGQAKITVTSSMTGVSLPWSRVSSGKPTVASGYGITDALNPAGGTMLGNLTLAATPTNNLHAATKGYVDTFPMPGGFETSDIVFKTTTAGQTGWLRCNGGSVSKITYSGLYAIISNIYTKLIRAGSGQPWKKQNEFSSEESIASWVTGTSVVATKGAQVVVTKNRAFLLGGQNGSGVNQNQVYSAPINADGTLGTWSSSTALSGATAYSQAIVTKNKIHLLGGLSVTAIRSATINADGTLGTWSDTQNLPENFGASSALVTKNRVYLLGGWTSTYSATVYTAPIDSNGNIGTWAAGTPLPEPIAYAQSLNTKDWVYLVGGSNASGPINKIFRAPINADGTIGTWALYGTLPTTIQMAQLVVVKNFVFLLGGQTAAAASSTVSTIYRAPINPDQSLGSWAAQVALPGPLALSQAIITSSGLYLVSGNTSAGVVGTVYKADFAGGLNDYSPYYAGDFLDPDPTGTNFSLPDLSAMEGIGSYAYIKT